MQISSRFSIAVHILSLLAIPSNTQATSEWIAGSVGTNPVVIRRVLGQLKRAELVKVKAGSGGASLCKELRDISLLAVYQATEVVEAGKLFHIHDRPNPECVVGRNIQAVLELLLTKAQQAMEEVLAATSMEELVSILALKQ